MAILQELGLFTYIYNSRDSNLFGMTSLKTCSSRLIFAFQINGFNESFSSTQIVLFNLISFT